MFTNHQQLISFGNFLLKTYGAKIHSNDGSNQPLYEREVSHADYLNWKQETGESELLLPCVSQIGDAVWLCLWSNLIACEILNVRFCHGGSVKYDLTVFGDNGEKTRLYNVDTAFLSKTKPVNNP